MNSLDQFFQNDIVHALGWTIIHSFWQGLLVVILLTIGLVMLSKHSSRIRYLVGYLALLSLAFCSVGTFFWYLSSSTQSASVSLLTGSSDAALTSVATLPVSEVATTLVTEGHFWQPVALFLEGNLPWITIIWMLGVLILSMRFLAEMAYVQRLKHQPGGQPMVSYQVLVNKLAASMGIKQFIELKENIRINSPMVIGFVKPVILVPFGLLSKLEPSQVESILAHELAHIRRHDYIFNLLQSLVEIVLFFNPATWWISSLIRTEREHSCDEMAIAETGNQLVFVQTLAKLEEYRSMPNNIALAFNGHRDAGVLGRIKRILNSEEQFRIPYKLFWSAMILLCSMGLFAFQDAPVVLMDAVVEVEESSDAEDMEEMESVVLASDLENITDKNQSYAIEKGEVLPLAKNRKPEKNTLATLTKEDAQRIPFRNAVLSETIDTVPPNIKKLRQEMMELAKNFREKEMAFQEQNRNAQKEMLALQKDVQKLENEQLKQLYELEKNAQEIHSRQNMKMKEREVEVNAIQNQMLEVKYKAQQLESQIQQEGANKEELIKQRSELIQQTLELEKKKRDFELTQKRKDLEIEKELQQFNNERWQIQKEVKINESNKRLEMMELEQRVQEIQFKSQMIQNELQNKMQLLEMQIQKEMQKWKEREER